MTPRISIRPHVSIRKITDPEEASAAITADTDQHLQDIRQRAFDYFQRRGQTVGNDWEDWLRAERELLWKPPAEMFENGRAIVLRVAVPGFDPRFIQVTASPHLLLIEGCETHYHQGLESRLHFCEFGQHLFRVFDLPARIDPGAVSASVDKGILEVVAGIARRRKADPEAEAQCAPDQAPAGGIHVAGE